MKYVNVCTHITPHKLKTKRRQRTIQELCYGPTYARAKSPAIRSAPSVSSNLGSAVAPVPTPASVEFADMSYALCGWIVVSSVGAGWSTTGQENNFRKRVQLN
jgi:hypothetical protein